MRSFLGFIYGIVYGVAHVVPGLSGGTFLVIFGCYETVCEAFALNIRTIKKHLFFLLFLGIGTIVGLIGFVHAITFFLDNFGIQTNLFFMGLILGGIPLIVKIATEEERFKSVCLLPFILGLALVVSLFFLEKFGVFEMDGVQGVDTAFFVRIALYSFVAAIAMVMPGISGAFILVAFGVYDMFIGAVKVFDFAVLLPAAIGAVIGIVFGAKLILLVIQKSKLIVYCAILGMVIGSVAPLFPDGLGLNAATLAGLVCLACGGAISIIMGARQNSA